MSHANMYSGEHSDVQMIAFLHAQFNPKLLHEIDERKIVCMVTLVRCISPPARASKLLETYFSTTRSNFRISWLALG